MPTTFTLLQIAAFAPDESSVQAARSFAHVQRWQNMGASTRAIWAECPGSGSNPYQCAVDLSEPAFKCSCPSRKFPCKHGLSILMLHVTNAVAFQEGVEPLWVQEWLGKRVAKRQASELKVNAQLECPPDAANDEKAAAAKSKRVEEREQKVQQGLADLKIWLEDIVRNGMADLPSRPLKFWEQSAARLVDAQATGVARMVRQLAVIANSGADWPERMLAAMGRMTLLIEAYERQSELPESVRADIRATVGWALRQEDVLGTGEGLTDRWVVTGQIKFEEDQLTVQRTWLLGAASRRPALILSFMRPGQLPDHGLSTGQQMEATVVFYPGAGFRAVIKDRTAGENRLTGFSGFANIEAMLCAFADKMAVNPWLEVFPAAVEGVVPVINGDNWLLVDKEGSAISLLKGSASAGWSMLAASGGHPITVFGEWDGEALRPMSFCAEGQMIVVGNS